MSITEPPLQTLPSGDPVIRTCVLPPEGHHLWAVDYQAQEARLFVNDAQDPALAQVILSGQDLYTHLAQVVYGDPSISKDDPRRSMFKVMVLAFFYGAGVDKLALITGMQTGEVQDMLKTLFYEYPSIASLTGDYAIGGADPGIFARKARERLEDEGFAYILTTGGRRFSMPAGEIYKATNGRMQGSGKDVMADAVLRLDAAGLADNIVLPVHDEIIFSFPEGDVEAPYEAARLMEDYSFPVPLLTEVKGPLNNWGDAYR
jgi:DNA polymerase-1